MHSCEICEELIEQIVRPKNHDPYEGRRFVNLKGVNVGWLDSIIENSIECTLCRLIARIWERVRVTDEATNEDQTISTRPPKRVYVYLDNSTPTAIAKNSVRLHWLIGIDFFYPSRDGSPSTPAARRWEPKFTLLADNVRNLGLAEEEQPFLLGRRRCYELPYDVDFVRECFQTCFTKHGEACSNPVRRNNGRVFPLNNDEELPLRMRCIDVLDQCVVQIPRDGSCQYAVLSYVWGASNFLLLTKANLAQMSAKDGLNQVRIPRTISEAIEVTISLGLRYLWVDSLCIVQDDRSEKLLQIQKMHKVYASATLTIVAAGANGADDGLWEMKNDIRQPQIEEEVSGLHFVGTEPTLEDVLVESIWKKRAWTYQEYVLSKRMLVFSKTQAYYSCEQSACAEDYVHTVSATGKQELHAPVSEEQFAVSVDRLLNFPEYWPTLIREYSKRDLSFESDGLNAAAGVIAAYSVGSKSSFICGLPLTGLFEYSMLWYPSGPMRRRGPCATGESFPTWSWVGWVGPVSYEDTDDTQDFDAGRIIHQWSLVSIQKTLSYNEGRLTVTYDTANNHGAESSSNAYLLEHKADADHHLTTIQSGLLSFQARVAQFRIASSCTNQFVMSDDIDCEFTGLYKVFQDNDWVGSIHLEHRIAQELLKNETILHDFVALSTGGSGPWYVSERTDPYDSETMGDVAVLYEDDDSSVDDPYNVMLINYDTDSTTALRAGIGQIRRDKFDHADPILKHIILG